MACEKFEGNLHKFIKGNKPFKEAAFTDTQSSMQERIKEAVEVAHQAVEGLVFSLTNISLDVQAGIKPSNFLIRRGLEGESFKWICKLTHLGISGGTKTVEQDERFPDPWTAPELATGRPNELHREKNFVWSMGCVLHFIFTGQHPYGQSIQEQMSNISLRRRPLKSNILQTGSKIDVLICEMLRADAEQRPDLKSVLLTIKQWQQIEEIDSLMLTSSANHIASIHENVVITSSFVQSASKTPKKRQRSSHKTI